MKFFYRIAALALLTTGCDHEIHVKDVENGKVVSETQGTIGFFDTDVETFTNNEAMETCTLRLGHMPNKEEQRLCVKQIRCDQARRNRAAYGWYYYHIDPRTDPCL